MEEKIYTLLDLIKKNGDESPDYEKIKELTPKIHFPTSVESSVFLQVSQK